MLRVWSRYTICKPSIAYEASAVLYICYNIIQQDILFGHFNVGLMRIKEALCALSLATVQILLV